MNSSMIQGLWSASASLANHDPLNKEEIEALKWLLQQALGNTIPSTREYQIYQEAKEAAMKSRESLDLFDPKIKSFEKKYTVLEGIA